MKAPMNISFIHDLSSLDLLRQKTMKKNSEESNDVMRSAAEQFEAIFTQLLFKSMRNANEAFKSNLMDDRTSRFYEQIADEQLSSALSHEGSLGLADLIVQQLQSSQGSETMDVEVRSASDHIQLSPMLRLPSVNPQEENVAVMFYELGDAPIPRAHGLVEQNPRPVKTNMKPFEFPHEFTARLTPYAKYAARTLGTDPAILIAQAALETGWGKKIIANERCNSHNLFNLKADPKWAGQKIMKQTFEFHDQIPVQKIAWFRAYTSYQDSFDDYVYFLSTNPRYANALQQSEQPEQFIRGLHDAGYATDPHYSDKVMRVFYQVQDLMKQ
ncbi:flagellar assembly peptidoglycan hydrolase FlgJ [Candidatus Enterovibrio altilux]|uniref:flagellar assembly peptidoglycan hydrolase FlgJ n=1 Tax=Candidatus Enterovibrio altilux TaxID=1927128 RepID=UPI0012380985|nr:flagellar assembly peptidoglycan hydrolase FlgJ [Candidatus Enterovibrio luxaltus]